MIYVTTEKTDKGCFSKGPHGKKWPVLLLAVMFFCCCFAGASAGISTYELPLTLSPSQTTVRVGDTITVEYSISRNTSNGQYWDGDAEICGYWEYVNVYEGGDVMAERADEGEFYDLVSDFTGSFSLTVDRSDFTTVVFHMEITGNKDGDIYFFGADGENGYRYYDQEEVSVSISDARKRSNITCDFSAAPTGPLAYGQTCDIGYQVRGLEATDEICDISVTTMSWDSLTDAEPASTCEVVTGSQSLSGTCRMKAENGNYVSIEVTVFFCNADGRIMYKRIESPRWEIASLSSGGETGWFTRDGKTYYADSNGNLYRGIRNVSWTDEYGDTWTEKYCFDDTTGALIHGWFAHNGSYAYADADGRPVYGYASDPLLTIEGTKYYFDGYDVVRNAIYTPDLENFYRSGDRGQILTGWHPVTGTYGPRYYSDENGVLLLGWNEVDGQEYYFIDSREGDSYTDDIGQMATGWQYVSVDETVYIFRMSGEVLVEYTLDNVIMVPENTETIAEEAFANTNGKFYFINYGVKKIEANAFSNLKQQKVIVFLDGNGINIASSAFSNSNVTIVTSTEAVYQWARNNGVDAEYFPN